ncbi:DUF418 domain-containing protein [Pseudobacillus sp. 179-B 2D1 NHS]|uniref:DUF418 domain-containing protein n=1 Tax=Pseudobacillus sp. 179-B 2D1 NHS TaxID=3374292 RepID=UPI00387962F8
MSSKRVKSIDSLRGFSLLGILLANLLIFQYGMIGKDHVTGLSWIDKGAYYITKVLIESSFMPIFTLLFGYSLIKLIESIRNKGRKSRWVIVRRAIGLILLGLLHATYLWEGDILLFYGLTMFFLFIFINRKAKTLMIWSGVFFILSTALMYGPLNDLTEKEQTKYDAYVEQEHKVYENGSYLEVYDFRNNAIPPYYDDPIELLFVLLLSPFVYAPLFLAGMAFAKMNVFENIRAEQKLYKYGSYLVPLAIVCKIMGQFTSNWEGVLGNAGGQLLALGYVFLFMRVLTSGKFAKFIYAFEQVGKLSLTNYLVQSVICTTIFYGYGFGMFGKMGVFAAMIMGIIIYALQCVISIQYFKKWKRGPVEMLLRMWTNFSLSGRLKEKKGMVQRGEAS